MYSEEPFLQEIRCNPEDQTPWLIFADWLEEHGDPLGEFIRVQCAMEEESCAVALGDLAQRESILMSSQRAALLSRLQPIGVRDIRFRRGLVDKALIEGKRFLDVPQTLFRTAPALRGLILRRLGQDSAESLRRLFDSRFFVSLNALDVADNNLGQAAASAIASAPRASQLQNLNCKGNQLGGQGIQELADNPHLTQLNSLNLANNSIALFDARKIARSKCLTSLISLNLEGNQIGDDGLHAIANSDYLTNLKSLAIGNNEIGVPGIKGFANSGNLMSLDSLNLWHTQLGVPGISMLASSSNCSSLKQLNLSACGLGPEGLSIFCRSPHFRALKVLDLSQNELEDGIGCLGASPQHVRLTTLRLRNNGIGDFGAETLAKAPFFDDLELLDLRDNAIAHPQVLRERFGNNVLL